MPAGGEHARGGSALFDADGLDRAGELVERVELVLRVGGGVDGAVGTGGEAGTGGEGCDRHGGLDAAHDVHPDHRVPVDDAVGQVVEVRPADGGGRDGVVLAAGVELRHRAVVAHRLGQPGTALHGAVGVAEVAGVGGVDVDGGLDAGLHGGLADGRGVDGLGTGGAGETGDHEHDECHGGDKCGALTCEHYLFCHSLKSAGALHLLQNPLPFGGS